ncbi:hypothetical protein GOTRE_076_00250 [Gordonia terrae NBRC 100016]|uniref:Transposase n=1 Tax=Gordonia terrae NBRC 100016 TaxID=1089454 RepID=A0ABQ0HGB7_9ACTN|nr:hypothetical protein GOTRE_076_00250 [Gordonia terrae NBRC 100016]
MVVEVASEGASGAEVTERGSESAGGRVVSAGATAILHRMGGLAASPCPGLMVKGEERSSGARVKRTPVSCDPMTNQLLRAAMVYVKVLSVHYGELLSVGPVRGLPPPSARGRGGSAATAFISRSPGSRLIRPTGPLLCTAST